MRIISKFRDFYDGVMRTGMDREVVYVREDKKIETTDDFGINFDTHCHGSYRRGEADLMFLGYCGQIIKIMLVRYHVKNPVYGAVNPTVERQQFFYDYDEFKSFMVSHGIASQSDFDGRWWPGKFQKFESADTNKMVDAFHRFQVPLFLMTHKTKYASKGITTIHLGPNLQKLDFHKFKDPYTTYQDIFQFVAGVLNRPDAKMVKISDKDKIHKHGFDKWSFRQKGPKK